MVRGRRYASCEVKTGYEWYNALKSYYILSKNCHLKTKMSGETQLVELALSWLVKSNNGLDEEREELCRETIRSFLKNPDTLNISLKALKGISDAGMVLRKLHDIVVLIDTPSLPDCPVVVMENRKKTRPWSQEEDYRMMAAIYKYGISDWAVISTFVGNGRTRSQCSQRWVRGLDPKINKCPWSKEDDERLLACVQSCGEKAWTRISQKLGNRSDVQCRYRYNQIMREKVELQMPVPTFTLPIISNPETPKSPESSPVFESPQPILPGEFDFDFQMSTFDLFGEARTSSVSDSFFWSDPLV